jgi:hypothetical protein
MPRRRPRKLLRRVTHGRWMKNQKNESLEIKGSSPLLSSTTKIKV